LMSRVKPGCRSKRFPMRRYRRQVRPQRAVSAVSARIRDMDDPPGSGGIGEAPALPLI
jgi:hypothetical protein